MKKKMCILIFLGIFPIACVRKKNVYMYFWVIFQQLKRKKNMLKKCSRNGFELLPNCILKKKNLYCNLAIVLQERGVKKNCIAIVLQEKGVVGFGLYCNRKIVLQPWECSWLGFVSQEKACRVRIVLQ